MLRGQSNENLLVDAVESGDIGLVKYLLSQKTPVSGKTSMGMSLLQAAYFNKHLDIAKLLIQAGADPNGATSYMGEFTLLTSAVVFGFSAEAIEHMIENGADINYSDNQGNTPLYYACLGSLANVEFLINKGANPFINDKNGISPLEVAKESGNLDIIKILENIERTPELVDQAHECKIANTFKNNLKNMSEMIILGLETEPLPKMTTNKHICVTNNEGYITDPVLLSHIILGAPLHFEHEGVTYPIGYNIFIPETINKAEKVIVDVYGGSRSIDARQTPDKPRTTIQLFLEQDCPVITLNLPDFLQNETQNNMDEKLHQLIHKAIHAFYETLKKNPSHFHPQMAEKGFDGADLFLYGASFGGRTAIRHGQLYPNTFKGYISHDGALSPIEDLPIVGVQRPFKYEQEILPSNNISSTVDPILVLQNRDDNNVNIRSALTFYKKLKEQGKSDLVRLCFFEKGGPFPGEGYTLDNKGHLLPPDYQSYVNAVFSFMEHGPSQLPEVHEHAFIMQEQVAAQFYRNENIKERFLALAHDDFNKYKHFHVHFFNDPPEWNTIWSSHYLPLLRTLGEVKRLATVPDYLQAQIDHYVQNGILTDEMIKNALKVNAGKFRELYKELNQFEPISEDDIVSNPLIIAFFKDKLIHLNESTSFDFKSYMLESLYFANPSLLPPLDSSKVWDASLLESVGQEYRNAFEQRIKESNAIARKAWTATTFGILKKRQSQLHDVKKDMDELNFLDIKAVYNAMFRAKMLIIRDDDVSIAAEQMLNTGMVQLKQQVSDIINNPSIHSEIQKLAHLILHGPNQQMSDELIYSLMNLIPLTKDKESLMPILTFLLLRIDMNQDNSEKIIKLNQGIGQCSDDEKFRQKVHKHSLDIAKSYHPELTPMGLNNLVLEAVGRGKPKLK